MRKHIYNVLVVEEMMTHHEAQPGWLFGWSPCSILHPNQLGYLPPVLQYDKDGTKSDLPQKYHRYSPPWTSIENIR